LTRKSGHKVIDLKYKKESLWRKYCFTGEGSKLLGLAALSVYRFNSLSYIMLASLSMPAAKALSGNSEILSRLDSKYIGKESFQHLSLFYITGHLFTS